MELNSQPQELCTIVNRMGCSCRSVECDCARRKSFLNQFYSCFQLAFCSWAITWYSHTGEQITHWDMLKKDTKFEFFCSTCPSASFAFMFSIFYHCWSCCSLRFIVFPFTVYCCFQSPTTRQGSSLDNDSIWQSKDMRSRQFALWNAYYWHTYFNSTSIEVSLYCKIEKKK